jgi:hypothetical protein
MATGQAGGPDRRNARAVVVAREGGCWPADIIRVTEQHVAEVADGTVVICLVNKHVSQEVTDFAHGSYRVGLGAKEAEQHTFEKVWRRDVIAKLQ